MKSVIFKTIFALGSVWCVSLSGCTHPQIKREISQPLPVAILSWSDELPEEKNKLSAKPEQNGIRNIHFQENPAALVQSGKPSTQDLTQKGLEISLDRVLEQVQARNPMLEQMRAAWQAASARYPQAKSLEDPMFGASGAPGAIGSNMVDGGYRLEISQKIPFPGKRRLRGMGALAEANAAANDLEDIRLQLLEAATIAFYDYYLVHRAITVNEDNLRLLNNFRTNAETRYKGGLVTQQDILQAEVEIGRQKERQLDLEQKRIITIARINTLMSQPPDFALPPPPTKLELTRSLQEISLLREQAVKNRPDLHALGNRLQADETSLALARKEFLPDSEWMAAYDAFWQEKPLRTMVGLRVNLPVQRQRRYAALAEAQAKITQRKAEFQKLTNEVYFQVQEAYEQVRTAEKTWKLYQETLLPAADANVKNAQSSYVTGKIPFLNLIEAQRNFVSLHDRFYEVTADYFRSLATLDRVIGQPLFGSNGQKK